MRISAFFYLVIGKGCMAIFCIRSVLKTEECNILECVQCFFRLVRRENIGYNKIIHIGNHGLSKGGII